MTTQQAQGSGNSSNGEINIPSSGLVLLKTGGKPYISRVIPLVCINAVNGKTFRNISNVFQECNKRISPFLANCYSSSAIIFVLLVFLVFTSGNHVAPGDVGSIIHPPFAASMPGIAFPPLASTGSGMASAKVHVPNEDGFSAVTLANALPNVSVFPLNGFSFREDFKLSKGQTDEYLSGRHNDVDVTLFMFSFGDWLRAGPRCVSECVDFPGGGQGDSESFASWVRGNIGGPGVVGTPGPPILKG